MLDSNEQYHKRILLKLLREDQDVINVVEEIVEDNK